MAETLTKQQRLAVTDRGGKLLVSAAAGSGKTKVLVDRLLGYLSEPNLPANIDDFLIITYTKAAASELRTKIAGKLTERIAREPSNRHLQRQVQRLYLTKISTIHSFCGDLLREYAYMLDIPADFRVADENECHEIQLQVLDQLLENAYSSVTQVPQFRALIDSQGYGRDDRQIPEIILKVFNSARCHLNPDQWLSWCAASVNAEGISDASETVWGSYLIDDLRQYLLLQIEALNACAQKAADSDGMEKVAALLEGTVSQLNVLYNCKTWDEIVKHKKIDYGRLTFSKKSADALLAEQIKAVRNACKKGLDRKLNAFSDDSAVVLADLRASGVAAVGLIQLVRQFESMYAAKKRMRRILDFSDLEHKTLDLLLGKNRSGITSIAREIGERYREIMIDEYQDSNEVQDQIFSALTQNRQNCFMVGDVKQSIYQFRLADPDIFVEKYNAYIPAEAASAGEGRKIVLSHNFRSSAGIISAVNDVFHNCMSPDVGGIDYTDDEMLREGIAHIPLNEPEVELYGIAVREDTYEEEAAFVANRIAELLNGKHMVRDGDNLRPICADDIVLLLRSPGSVGNEFQYALEKRGIPCATGSGMDLLQTEEISVLYALLQVISNPIQDIPLLAVLSSRIFSFTADDLAAIRIPNKHISFYDAVKRSERDQCRQFVAVLNSLRRDSRVYNLPQLLQQIFIKTRIDSIYAAMPDGDERKENLQIFTQLAADYVATSQRGLDQFLDHLDAMKEKGILYGTDHKNAGSVTIMSIHKSKGLEFPVVFLCGLSRNFNMESAHAQVLCDKDLGLGLSCMDSKNRVRYPSIAKRAISAKIHSDSISEEMRVLYVAMTRPKDRLIMTYAVKNLDIDLCDIIYRSSHTGKRLLTKEVTSPGEWVLQTALKRTEAGEFYHIAGCPGEASVSQFPWKIVVVDQIERIDSDVCVESKEMDISAEVIDQLGSSLEFSYPYSSATYTPSKLTATQLKGRKKDAEAAENTDQTRVRPRIFRKPDFAGMRTSGKDVGNAIHAVMQYIHYEVCTNEETVKAEIDRLVAQRLISPEQGALVDEKKIARLFSSPTGVRMRSCKSVLREFKFSILDDGEKYLPETQNEQILLQGVVDCALIEQGGISVIDFKTDYVTEATLAQVCARYTPQVTAYAAALQRIYEKPVCEVLLYFFHLDQFVPIQI